MIRGMIAVALALQSPVFRSSTRLVEINVTVHDKHGAVAGLTRDDFTLFDRGTARRIDVFSQSTVQRGSEPALPANTFSNRAANRPASVTIVLLDALNTLHYGTLFSDLSGAPTHYENQASVYGKFQLMKFIRDLDPNDRVAIYALGKSLRVLCDFTGDPAELQRVLREYHDSTLTLAEIADPPPANLGAGPEFDAAVDAGNQKAAALANGDRASQTIAALQAIANHAADIPGRKNLVWLTANLPFAGPAAARILGRANIAIYPVDSRGLIASRNPYFNPQGIDAMQEMADETGGRAFYNTNDLSTAIRTAVEDADVTYTLGFYADRDSLDGKFHELKVRVDRGGLDVRHPSGYFALKDEPGAAERLIRSAWISPLESSAIHLVARVDRAGAALKVGTSINLADLNLSESAGARNGSVEIFVVEQDAVGNVLNQKRNRLKLSLSPAQYESYLKSGILFSEQVSDSGASTVRIVVGDPASGRVGSLIIPLSRVH